MQCEKCGCDDVGVLEYGEMYTLYECEACGETYEEEVSMRGDVAFDVVSEEDFG